MVKRKYPTPEEINQMQSFYDKGHSLRDIQKEFNLSNGGWSRSVLIECLQTRHKPHYSAEERKTRSANKVIRWKQRRKQKLVEYKGGKCELCGYNKCVRSLEFHHKDPNEKDFNVSSVTFGIERCKREVDKCMLVCSNCHGEIHFKIDELRFSNNEK